MENLRWKDWHISRGVKRNEFAKFPESDLFVGKKSGIL